MYDADNASKIDRFCFCGSSERIILAHGSRYLRYAKNVKRLGIICFTCSRLSRIIFLARSSAIAGNSLWLSIDSLIEVASVEDIPGESVSSSETVYSSTATSGNGAPIPASIEVQVEMMCPK